MASGNQAPNMIAGGTIFPSRFVTVSTVADNTCLQASGKKIPIIGISQVGTFDPPGVTGSGSQAASAGQEIQIWGIGSSVDLQAGTSGGFNHGDLLTSDASGQGTAAVIGGGSYIGAVALESATTGLLGRVVIVNYYLA